MPSSYIQFSNPVQFQFSRTLPTTRPGFSMKSMFSNNAQVCYKPHSLSYGGIGSMRNSRAIARKTWAQPYFFKQNWNPFTYYNCDGNLDVKKCFAINRRLNSPDAEKMKSQQIHSKYRANIWYIVFAIILFPSPRSSRKTTNDSAKSYSNITWISTRN